MKKMGVDDVERLTNETVYFFNRFSSWETSVIRSSDLTLSETHAIEILGAHGEMNMKNLAERLGVTTGTVTVTVDRLEKKGYAKRGTTEEDRRAYIIELTPAGKKAFEEHHHHHLRLTQELMLLLDKEEIGAFIEILQKLNEHF
jgi:DNA-binding MarR family transcriptional regulator